MNRSNILMAFKVTVKVTAVWGDCYCISAYFNGHKKTRELSKFAGLCTSLNIHDLNIGTDGRT